MLVLPNVDNGEPVRLVTARAIALSGESSSAGADGVGDTGGCPSGCTNVRSLRVLFFGISTHAAYTRLSASMVARAPSTSSSVRLVGVMSGAGGLLCAQALAVAACSPTAMTEPRALLEPEFIFRAV